MNAHHLHETQHLLVFDDKTMLAQQLILQAEAANGLVALIENGQHLRFQIGVGICIASFRFAVLSQLDCDLGIARPFIPYDRPASGTIPRS
ncbi:hypothetical protein ACFSR7_01950 [Cohnella sp. GCM10020058]|uniref:hypothetical protein n=1 Tax=Cohnella sp. GCM10020058 TaxID=3317330 RepID=UPI00362678C7